MTEEFDLSNLEPIYQDFTLNKKNYRVREASEDAVIAYGKTMMKDITLSSEGKPLNTNDGVHECNSVLVSKCLFSLREQDGNMVESPVTLGFTRLLGTRVVTKLGKWIKKNSDMEKDESPEAIRVQIKTLTEKLEKIECKDKKDGSKQVTTEDTSPKELTENIENTSP